MGQFTEGNDLGQKFQTGKEQAEVAKKGGIASGIARRKKASLKEALLLLLDQQHKGKDGTTKSGYEVVAIQLYNRVMKGDTKAIKLLAELIGEYKQQTDITSGGQPFEMKVVQVQEDMKEKISEYLNGGLDR